MWYKKINENAITFLVLYMNDILLIENDILILTSIKVWLSKKFSMKDLRKVSYILEIKVYRDRSKRMLGLSQKNMHRGGTEEVQHEKLPKKIFAS